jgi:short subunit dehydrogenase-like uncharacterized protein
MSAARDLDVVLYGATGFVGKLTARYLAEHAPEGVRIGLGGRSEAKLAAVRDEIGGRAAVLDALADQDGGPFRRQQHVDGLLHALRIGATPA